MRWPFGTKEQIRWAFALVALRMLIMGTALYGVLRPLFTHGENMRSGRGAELAENAALTALSIVFVYVFLFQVARARWSDIGFSREGALRNVGIGVLTFCVGLVYVTLRLWGAGALDDAAHTFVTYTLGQRIEIALVAIHVIFGEEILFRGYLQPGLRARLSAPVAIGITAVVFAAYHANFDPVSFLGYVFWGVLWGVARERTGSTIAPSVAHFMNWSILGWI